MDHVAPHPQTFSFQKTKSPTDNAKYHMSNNKLILIKIDLKNFFPNININQVYHLFRNLKFSHEFSLILSYLCMDSKWSRRDNFYYTHYNHYLPQGAPTSPQISNLIFGDVDFQPSAFAKANNLKYSRYADDSSFSTEYLQADVGFLINGILDILKKNRFVFNKEKIRVLRPNMRQSVTSIVINNGIHARKEIIQRIRSLLFLLKYKISDIPPEYGSKKQQLNGLIAYLNTIEPINVNKYWKEFETLK